MKVTGSELVETKQKIKGELDKLDARYKTIWELKVKDFEDLKWEIKHYLYELDNVEYLRDKVIDYFDGDGDKADEYLAEYIDRLSRHLDHYHYFTSHR